MTPAGVVFIIMEAAMKQLIGVVVLLLLVVAPATAQDNVLTLITQ